MEGEIPKSEGGSEGASAPEGGPEQQSPQEGLTENEIVAIIIGVTVVGLIVFAFYIYSNRRYYGFGGTTGSPKFNLKEMSKERDAYYKVKATLDLSKPADAEELKKALMRRAMFTIPMILSLQQQGNSVGRLYSRGMLTDNIMDNVKMLKEFVDSEFPDVQAEADDIINGWGAAIWQEAMQFHRMVQQHHNAEKPTNPAETGPLHRDQKEKKAAAAERRRRNAEKIGLTPAELLKKKELEAEKMANQLLMEEEREKSKKKK